MSRSKFTNESSVPHQRGRKQMLKGKRLSNKRVRVLSVETDVTTLKRVRKYVRLDKDPTNNFNYLQ